MEKRIQNRKVHCSPAAVLLFIGLFFLVLLPGTVRAEDVVEIRTKEDLLQIAENPSGSFRLMTDIDLKGEEWTPVDFTGSFDGNGFSLLNVNIRSVGAQRFTTIDGNRIAYDTAFTGFFSSLVGAQVTNLKLLGLSLSVDTTEPVFAGLAAGYMEDSLIAGCEVHGEATLSSSGQSFGLGGIAGFGSGAIENTKADVTLICNDTDTEYKDEQFMGGAYAAGFIDLKGNEIKIDGYDSDHGYVHDGGLVGMYILYPEDSDYMGYMLENTVSGRIRFFEDNEDRRAYCEAFIGEIMNWSFEQDDSFSGDAFTRDEVFEYDTVLLPHACADPQYETSVTEATETANGFTQYRCRECGYTFRSDFTVRVGSFVPEIRTEEESSVPSALADISPAKEGRGSLVLIIVIAGVVLLIIISAILISVTKRKR